MRSRQPGASGGERQVAAQAERRCADLLRARPDPDRAGGLDALRIAVERRLHRPRLQLELPAEVARPHVPGPAARDARDRGDRRRRQPGDEGAAGERGLRRLHAPLVASGETARARHAAHVEAAVEGAGRLERLLRPRVDRGVDGRVDERVDERIDRRIEPGVDAGVAARLARVHADLRVRAQSAAVLAVDRELAVLEAEDRAAAGRDHEQRRDEPAPHHDLPSAIEVGPSERLVRASERLVRASERLVRASAMLGRGLGAVR